LRQVVRPPGEYSPATQWCSSLLSSSRLVPSHAWPAVHVEHVERVLTVPPLVYDAVWHVLHAFEAQLSSVPGEYSLSAPQFLHVCTPPSLRKSATTDGPVMYVPAGHAVMVEPPSHE
jgi:hypothetical protein